MRRRNDVYAQRLSEGAEVLAMMTAKLVQQQRDWREAELAAVQRRAELPSWHCCPGTSAEAEQGAANAVAYAFFGHSMITTATLLGLLCLSELGLACCW